MVSKKIILPIAERLYKYRVSGIENLLGESSIIAMNQSTNLDAFALNGAVLSKINKPILFVSRSYPQLAFGLVDFYLKKLGHVMVSQNCRKAINSLRNEAPEILKSNYHLGIFPEGVRTRKEKLGHFHTGAAHIAINTEKPIIPVYMTDLYKSSFGDIIDIKIGEPIYNDGIGKNGECAKRLTEKVKKVIFEMSDYPGIDTVLKN